MTVNRPATKEHQETEGHLRSDQCVHQAAPGVRVFSAFQRDRRLHRRGAQRRGQPEQQRHAEGQRQAECGYPPVRRQHQPHGVVRRIDTPGDERRGPPREESADGGRQKCQHGALHQHQLHQPPASRADRHAQRHLAGARSGLGRHQIRDIGAGNQQHQRHQHPQRSQRVRYPPASRRCRRPPAPAIASAKEAADISLGHSGELFGALLIDRPIRRAQPIQNRVRRDAHR